MSARNAKQVTVTLPDPTNGFASESTIEAITASQIIRPFPGVAIAVRSIKNSRPGGGPETAGIVLDDPATVRDLGLYLLAVADRMGAEL